MARFGLGALLAARTVGTKVLQDNPSSLSRDMARDRETLNVFYL